MKDLSYPLDRLLNKSVKFASEKKQRQVFKEFWRMLISDQVIRYISKEKWWSQRTLPAPKASWTTNASMLLFVQSYMQQQCPASAPWILYIYFRQKFQFQIDDKTFLTIFWSKTGILVHTTSDMLSLWSAAISRFTTNSISLYTTLDSRHSENATMFCHWYNKAGSLRWYLVSIT